MRKKRYLFYDVGKESTEGISRNRCLSSLDFLPTLDDEESKKVEE